MILEIHSVELTPLCSTMTSARVITYQPPKTKDSQFLFHEIERKFQGFFDSNNNK